MRLPVQQNFMRILCDQEPVEIEIYDFLLLLVGAISAVMMVSIAASQFYTQHVVLTGLAVSFLLVAVFRLKLLCRAPKFDRHTWLLMGISLIAVVLRMDLYPHYIGGQDQGLYVTMSETLRRYHGLQFADELRQWLPEALRNVYDLQGMMSILGPEPKDDTFSVVFYPLHPAWMAVARSAFGFGFHTLSLFGFSLLALTGVYHFTKRVARDKTAATLALFFCATNPLLVFLSKFPLSEMVAFALTVNAAYALQKGLAADSPKARLFYLLLSLSLVNALFYVRISIFVFIPVMCCAYVLSYAKNVREDVGRSVRRYVVGIIILFAVSLAYYYVLQRPIFAMVRKLWLEMFPSPNLAWAALFGVGCAAILVGNYLRISGREKSAGLVTPLSNAASAAAPYVFAAALCFSVFSLFNVIQTGRIAWGVTVPPAWAFSPPPGLSNVKYHIAYRFLLALSPFLVAYLLIPRVIRGVLSTATILLLLFLASAWFVTLTGVPTLAYLYYHGRYISAEIIPCALVLVSIVLANELRLGETRRRISIAAIVGVAVYYLAWSGAQIGKIESDNPGFIAEMDRIVTDRDLLIASADEVGEDIAVPLRHYLGKNVFYLNAKFAKGIEGVRATMQSLLNLRGERFDRILLLTNRRQDKLLRTVSRYNRFDLDVQHRYIVPYETQFFTNGERAYQERWAPSSNPSTFLLPAEHVVARRELFIDEVVGIRKAAEPITSAGCEILFGYAGAGRYFLKEGWSISERDYVWSDGRTSRVAGLLKPVPANGPTTLTVLAHAYAQGDEKQRVIVNFNDLELGTFEVGPVPAAMSMPIPPHAMRQGGEWNLQFRLPDAHSPASRQEGQDDRLLGIGIRALKFETTGPKHGADGEPCGPPIALNR